MRYPGVVKLNIHLPEVWVSDTNDLDEIRATAAEELHDGQGVIDAELDDDATHAHLLAERTDNARKETP